MSRARELANYRGLPDRIEIPDLTGLIMAAVLRQSVEVGFTLAVDDPPAPIKDLASSGRWVVAGQDPPAGSTRYRGDTVVVTLRRYGGGEAGDREPRQPLPRTLRSLEFPDRPDDPPVERLGSVRRLDPRRADPQRVDPQLDPQRLDPLGAPGGAGESAEQRTSSEQ